MRSRAPRGRARMFAPYDAGGGARNARRPPPRAVRSTGSAPCRSRRFNAETPRPKSSEEERTMTGMMDSPRTGAASIRLTPSPAPDDVAAVPSPTTLEDTDPV